MTVDVAKLTDELLAAAGFKRGRDDVAGLAGFGFCELFDAAGRRKLVVPFKNLITDTGDTYYANRSYPLLASTVNISSSTNATPIVVTTSSAHHLSPGDKVTVAGHTTNTNANGTWVVGTVGGGSGEDGATTLQLLGAAGNGVGGATGTVQGLATGKAAVMRLGTGTTAVAKNGAGSAIVTYAGTGVTATKGFDASYPQLSDLGAGLGKYTVYKTTWNAGECTVNALAEVVIGIDNKANDGGGTASFTIARALLSPTVNKGSSDTLALTWNHKFLGA